MSNLPLDNYVNSGPWEQLIAAEDYNLFRGDLTVVWLVTVALCVYNANARSGYYSHAYTVYATAISVLWVFSRLGPVHFPLGFNTVLVDRWHPTFLEMSMLGRVADITGVCAVFNCLLVITFFAQISILFQGKLRKQ